MKRLILLTLSLMATAASARGGGGTSTESKGFYWVPVGPDLLQYSAFPVAQIEVKDLGDQLKVEYALPQELTGALNLIEVSGPKVAKGEMTLTSPQATMICPNAPLIRNCRVIYKKLDIDVVAREEILKGLAATEEELSLRRAVAELFEKGEKPVCAPTPAFRLFGIMSFPEGGEPHGFLSATY